MRRRKTDTVLEIDRFIGGRIRERRTELGISQSELAQRIGVAGFTISKYEMGDNGLSASRLYEIAGQLTISPEYFFEGFEDPRSSELPAKQRLLLNLVRSSGQIGSRARLEALAHIVRVLAGND